MKENIKLNFIILFLNISLSKCKIIDNILKMD